MQSFVDRVMGDIHSHAPFTTTLHSVRLTPLFLETADGAPRVLYSALYMPAKRTILRDSVAYVKS